MEVIFYVVLVAAVDYSEGEQRAEDYFVTRLSEHEWRRRGVEGRKREWGIGQRCSGEWMRAGGHIGDCKVGVEILPMSLDQVRLIFRIRLISNSLYELVIQNELSFVAPFSLRSKFSNYRAYHTPTLFALRLLLPLLLSQLGYQIAALRLASSLDSKSEGNCDYRGCCPL